MIRIGQGFDIHNIEKKDSQNRVFILGGVVIDETYGIKAHSDGDTLYHSIVDAVLGAIGAGYDIGDYFSDSDPKCLGISSEDMLKEILTKTEYKKAWVLNNLDLTIVLQSPKVGDKKTQIQKRVADTFGVDVSQIGIKAKTFEDKSQTQVWVWANILIDEK